MIKNLAEDKKRLLTNFVSLAVIQGSSMILPLITLPYLVRVLGAENFGLLSFSLAIVMYFNLFVSFGFELSATREISIHRENMEKVSEIFSSVMIIKLIFVLFSLMILSIIVLFFDSFREYAALYFVTFGAVIGNALFPIWFFQGMERMKYITYFTLATKIFYTLFIFVVVHEKSDYIYVPLLNSIGLIVSGMISIWMVLKYYPVHFVFPSRTNIIYHIQDSAQFFLSRIANQGSGYYATTIIGIYFGNTIVGYYSMIQKLLQAFRSLGGIVAQTIYPYMAKTKNIIMFKKIFILVVSIAVMIWLPILYYRDLIIDLVFHLQNEMLSDMFLIMFSSAIFSIVSALIGYPLLAAMGYTKYANNSLIIASIFNAVYITLIVILTKNIYLATSSVVFFNLFTIMLRFYYLNKTEILSSGKKQYDN